MHVASIENIFPSGVLYSPSSACDQCSLSSGLRMLDLLSSCAMIAGRVSLAVDRVPGES